MPTPRGLPFDRDWKTRDFDLSANALAPARPPTMGSVVVLTTDRADVLEEVGVAAVAYDAARRALEEAVTRARAQGSSWSEVGAVLGITRQAAFQRFGDRRARNAPDSPAAPEG